MADVASQTFDFVGRELNATLTEARTALESYVEQPLNFALLERCARELHQVQGVLRVLEIYGAALLAEEMEHVARYLLATAAERKSQAESLDALMRAMVQLPSYLERVLAGGRDLALVLLPLLNDLRAVRGSSLLSEGTLLLLNLKSDKQAQPIPVGPGELPLTVEQWGRRLRTRFQVGLIGWIRGERIEQNLEILAAVSSKLEQIATHQPYSSCGGWSARSSRRCRKAPLKAVSRSSACWDWRTARSNASTSRASRATRSPRRSSFSIIFSITSAAPRPRVRVRSRCAPRFVSPSSCRWMRTSRRSARISPPLP
jgi:hypothetical protein